MSIGEWSSLSSLDDDRLALEAAALLSLFPPQSVWLISRFLGEWIEVGDLLMTAPRSPEDIEQGLSGDWVREAGLELPSLASGLLCPDPVAALHECAILIAAANRKSEPLMPHIAVAYLNLYAAVGTHELELHDEIDTSLVWDAWRCVRAFILAMSAERFADAAPDEPTMVGGVFSEWMSHDSDLSSDDPAWTAGLGPMFQSLNGWDSTWSMPPRPCTNNALDWAAYWAPLPTLAIGVLGWSDPALGLARWILMGMPSSSSPALSLLKRVWGSDSLRYFCHPQMDWDLAKEGKHGLIHSGRMIAQLFTEPGDAGSYVRCGGLHMGDHLDRQLMRTQAGDVRIFQPLGKNVPQEYFVHLNRYEGWYAQLRRIGRKLSPQPGASGLTLTLVAPPFGLLGTFRHSEDTGRWHATQNDIHLLGNSRLVERMEHPFSAVFRDAQRETAYGSRGHRSLSPCVTFFVASELARRHAGYGLYWDDKFKGPLDASLHLKHDKKPEVFLPRDGRVGSLYNSEHFILGPAEILAFASPRELIQAIEGLFGLTSPRHSLPTDRHNIMYRTMSHILSATERDRSSWNFFPDTPFPAGRSWQPKDLMNDEGQYSWATGLPWTLVRDDTAVAMVTPDGMAYIGGDKVDLLAAYAEHARKLVPMVRDVFGDILP